MRHAPALWARAEWGAAPGTSLVNYEAGLVYLNISKCGSTSFKDFLGANGFVLEHDGTFSKPPGFFAFAVVRDPVDRWVSALHQFLQDAPTVDVGAAIRLELDAIEVFGRPLIHDSHTIPQVEFLDPRIPCDLLLRLEEGLGETAAAILREAGLDVVGTLGRSNVSPVGFAEQVRGMLDEDHVAVIRDFYGLDGDLFDRATRPKVAVVQPVVQAWRESRGESRPPATGVRMAPERRPRLNDWQRDTYSQFGEDGVIAHILDVIGEQHRVAVEFGAHDGLSCSNTARLWRDQRWRALLVEADTGRHELLVANAAGYDVAAIHTTVEPTGPRSISGLLKANWFDPGAVDVMSIDIDGADWMILAELEARPRLLVIEFNQTIPPHISARQTTADSGFGASLRALIDIAAARSYSFIGSTHCNAFFVQDDLANRFADYETDPCELHPTEGYAFLATDGHGRAVVLGDGIPWAPRVPLVDEITASVSITPVTTDPQAMLRGFEDQWGDSYFVEARDIHPDVVRNAMEQRVEAVVLDLTQAVNDPGHIDWVWEMANQHGYRAIRAGVVLAFVAPGIT